MHGLKICGNNTSKIFEIIFFIYPIFRSQSSERSLKLNQLKIYGSCHISSNNSESIIDTGSIFCVKQTRLIWAIFGKNVDLWYSYILYH